MRQLLRIAGVGGLLITLVASTGGCGKVNMPPLVPVRGTVIYKEKPVAHAGIVFIPDGSKGTKGPAASCATSPGGKFALRSGPSEGAIVGTFKVVIHATRDLAIPEKYTNAGTTTLSVTIPPAGDTNLTITIPED